MQEVGEEISKDNKGPTMVAILGIPPEEVEKLCKEIDGIVEPVNYNSPIQTVVAGEPTAISNLIKLARKKRIKAIPLKVSVPSHSSLMKPAAEKFKKKLEEFTFQDAQIPIVQNYDAQPHISAKEIKENLYLQLFNPVRWTEVVNFMAENNTKVFIEIGPKNVLTKLIKQIRPEVEAISIQKVEDLKNLEKFN